MTEQHRTAPVPGPPPGGPAPAGQAPAAHAPAALAAQPAPGPVAEAAGQPFADLERRPVAEHVAVFEAEHARLQQELSSIDQL
jgi:hypothetical protein